MTTYQDLLLVNDNDKDRAQFVRSFITSHKRSDAYKTAQIAEDYDRSQNTTITNYQKTITAVTGEQVADRFSATHRSCTNFYHINITQLSQYLLGNGAMLKDSTVKKLGDDFDNRLQQIGESALCGGSAFGFFNLDHVEAFSLLDFAPLYDEETGSLKAGVRFWQIDKNKPLRATLFELDGYTDYMFTSRKEEPNGWDRIDKGIYMQPKKAYKVTISRTEAEGTIDVQGGAYPDFPIIPMYANKYRQAEIVGMREKIDAYDFILNGFEDDLDNAQLYWIIQGAGGMLDPDLQQFLERLKTVKAAAPGDGQSVTPVQVEIPYAAREALLDRLEKQLYKDAMLMNPEDIASGAVTATQIRAAYERQNNKADQFEYQVLDFCDALFKVAEVDDEPTFTRSTIVNTQEEINGVIMAAPYTGDDYTRKKLLTLLGDGDKYDEITAQLEADGIDRITPEQPEEEQEQPKTEV